MTQTIVVLPDEHRLPPAGIFLVWCRRLMLFVLVALSLYDREWGFVIVLLTMELLGIFIRLLHVKAAELETIGRVHAAVRRGNES